MATYYVDGAVGDNGNVGTSEGVGNAWATIQYAESQANNLDHIYVKASTAYTETLTIADAGASTAYIWIEGYSGTPGDKGKITIDGESTRAYGITCSLGAVDLYWRIENFTIANHTGHGVNFTTQRSHTLDNCDSIDNGGHGFEGYYGSILVGCMASGNTGDGFNYERTSTFYNCKAIGNLGTYGFYQQMGGAYINCLAVGNATTNFYSTFNTTYGATHQINCTSDGSGKTTTNGFMIRGAGHMTINCIATDCTVGFYSDSYRGHSLTHHNNLAFNNTTDYSAEYNYGSPDKSYDVTADPLFSNTGTTDYSLLQGSPARNAGMDMSGNASEGMDIGAYQMFDKRKVIVG